MSATTATASRTPSAVGTIPAVTVPLARLEMARMARHPVLIAGTLFGVVSTLMAVQDMRQNLTGDILGMPVTALTVGVPAMIAAQRLTRSFHGSEELVDAAPTSSTTRTAALCASALVPAVIASAWLVFYYAADTRLWTTPDWMLGTLSPADLAAILTGHTVVAAVGGTLLGVAAGRWWRFRGAVAVLVVVVAVWTLGVIGAFSSEGVPASWTRWVRLFTPVNAFSNPAPSHTAYDTLTGSPLWYLGWLVTLCGLAAVAALLKGSEGATRRRLVRIGAVVLAASALTYGLAVAGGNAEIVRTYPDGHSVLVAP